MRDYIVIGLLVAALLCAVLYVSSHPAVPEVQVTEEDGSLLRFVYEHLVDGQDGGVYTNLREDLPALADTARNHDKLSESTGLLLQYALEQDRQDIYLQQMFFIKNKLLGKDGLVRWVIPEEGKREDIHVNASIDDLRIIRYLLEGSERWSRPEDRELALQIAGYLEQHNLAGGGVLADYSHAVDGSRADAVTASYLDILTMRRLVESQPQWEAVARSSHELLRGAARPGGFFAKTYILSEQRWLEPENGYNLIDTLIAAIRLAEIGEPPEETAAMLREVWQRDGGRLYAVYDGNRQIIAEFESPAVYSLAAQLLRMTGTPEIAEAMLLRMREHAVQDPDSPYAGGFMIPDTLECYSFDNLLALIADPGRK